MIAHFCYQSCRLGLVILHPVFLFFVGSARRKLTCTICNRKCSSSLNLQEHRKVRLNNIYCTAQIIPPRYFALGLRGFTQLMQFCMIHFYSDVSFLLFLAAQWNPSHSTVSLTQSNLLILHPSSLCSVIPSPREGCLYDQVVTKLFWVTKSRGVVSFSLVHPTGLVKFKRLCWQTIRF